MPELVPIIESGDLKNIVFQNALQFLYTADPSYEGMTLEMGPSGWVMLNRTINNNKTWEDTNSLDVALVANVESAAICTVTIDEDIPDGFGTYLLTFLYSAATSPSTITVRSYVNGGLNSTVTADIETNTVTRTLPYSGTISGALTSGDVITFTVECTIAATVKGATQDSILRVIHVRENDHQRLLNRDDNFAHTQYALAGYGGIDKVTDTNYGTIGDGAWTTIDNWDQGSVTAPIGVVQDFTNSGLHFDEIGVYSVSFLIALTFTEVNQGRRIQVRVLNQTEGTATGGLIYAVARNSDGVNISIPSLLVEIPSGEINDLFQLQIAGNGDSFAQATVIAASFTANRISGAL